MIFWIITTAIAVVVAAMVLVVLLRNRDRAEPAAAYDLRVYRTQLKDVDADLERGVLSEEDATRVRTEISRRILLADAQLREAGAESGQSGRGSLIIAMLLGLVMVGGSFALYRDLGAPGYGDLALAQRIEMAEQARANRPGQAAAEASLPPGPAVAGLSAEYLTLLERLRETVAQRPDDLQGQLLLARNEAAAGNFQAAYDAQQTVIRLKGGGVTAGDYADLADMMVLAAGGYVSPEAENALRQAIALDPGNGPARYYWGLMMAQTGRPDTAFRVWNALLRDGPADARWIVPVRAQIEEMAFRAGVEFTLPPAPDAAPAPGPTAEEVEAARDMSPEDRQQMIRGMVQGLSDRLASQGGPPGDWARLISALGVLGETDRAQAIYVNATQVFAGNDAALDMVNGAAQQAGLIE